MAGFAWSTLAAASLVALIALLLLPPKVAFAHEYRADLAPWNLNQNQQAGTNVLEYSTSRPSGNYTPSPTNWRELPFYTILLDKFADGDPSNNDFFGTMFESDPNELNLRFGGDVRGLVQHLDYIQGMGIRGIYIAGTPFLNMPWQADSYSALDFSILDPHWGTIGDWRSFIDELHTRGMYIMADFTVGTMGDFIGFKGHLNTSTPFNLAEYDAVWKEPAYAPWGLSEYPDFKFSNTRNESCQLPTFWLDDGTIVEVPYDGCYASEFDQFGDMEAFGVHPDWQRQLSKFASVQDRLREWQTPVMAKLKKFSCMVVEALDIDGIRIDKATQVTLDALADWTTATHACAKALGKANFFIPGEVTGGDRFGSLYIGRGRTLTQHPPGFIAASQVTADQAQFFLRDRQHVALDAVAFHYSIYRSLCRFLGMDGNLQVAYDIDVNFVTAWNQMFVNNDLLNKETGAVDPRHMYGVSNFDVFRWPALANGTEKNILGSFITALVMPGIPLYYYGEEQGLYILDNGAANYIFGRQPMTASRAWQRHGCYVLGSAQYYNFPLDRAIEGCRDEWNSLDHFDPTAPPRRLISRFNHLRTIYPALQDGFNLVQWGNKTHFIELPGSNQTLTEVGLWYVSRAALPSVQNFTGPHADQIYLLYTNENVTINYAFDCKKDGWITSPYVSGTVLRNLFAPFETYTLEDSLSSYFNDSNPPYRGCLPAITVEPLSFKALVPQEIWVGPRPMLTAFQPGHDFRIATAGSAPNDTVIDIVLQFNVEMSCDAVTAALSLNASSSGSDLKPRVRDGSVDCKMIDGTGSTNLSGDVISAWQWSATLFDVPDGIIQLILNRPGSSDGSDTTHAIDHLLLRKGSRQNVMVFPAQDYDTLGSFQKKDGSYMFNHHAKGADLLRYSWNFGQNWTSWTAYEDITTIPGAVFDSCVGCFWEGEHIIVQYWSELAGSTAHVVHADLGYGMQRRVPQMLVRGPYNTWGYDKGVPANMEHKENGVWELEIMAQWPSFVQVNIFGFDNFFFGDTDGDGVMERLPPNTVAPNYFNMSVPPEPHLAWALRIDDATGQWHLEPRGHSIVGAVMFVLLLLIPILTAILSVLLFRWVFYGIKFNQWGMKPKESRLDYLPILGRSLHAVDQLGTATQMQEKLSGWMRSSHSSQTIGWPEDTSKRRKVLIATLEYEIIDWKLKVKIGGLGVMSSLMGKAMSDVDLVWVVPKVKDIEYPTGDYAEPIEVVIFGETYLIEAETHVVDNITYVILDSPVFRAQTKADPYPARMDDLSSAIFYSTWNQAIATVIRRFPLIDIYHVNDYHGALAPIYLLPKVIPVCLSLHNAEFQGLWPLRTKEEMKEVCSAFNISKEYCTKYVQFGNTFNLLHAAASFISVHQKSVGVAGVSDKYGKRSWARYPALWTLKHVDSLPNPDPSDIAALDESPTPVKDIQIDPKAEAARPELKRQAQEWAKLKQDPEADLFVFVGRWSKQKGVDLIADVMPSILEKRPTVQIICVGPVIDLYGRFAAEKLARLMELYPERVYSKPEFTALPPYLFSGADFALIPSRDEPFGLVAVEFGRKGALGVGSRLGGLGLMPGWWFPVESNSTTHMLSQLTKTIKLALGSSQEERAVLRARSAVQRFPVVEWRQRMEDFHKRSVVTSRHLAGDDAWRESDCVVPEPIPVPEVEDWTPEDQENPIRPDWANSSMESRRSSNIGDNLQAPPIGQGHSNSNESSSQGGARYLSPQSISRRSSVSTDVSEGDNILGRSRNEAGDSVDIPPDLESGGPYEDFLARANRQISKDQKNTCDPFMENNGNIQRPFAGKHSRYSSVESISSIVDEKSDSPLNRAMESFTDQDGEVAQTFISKLQALSAANSKGELSIERFLVKSEEAFFDKVKKDKISSAASILSSRRESTWGGPPSLHYESRSTSPLGEFGNPFGASSLSAEKPPMNAMQIRLSREIRGWPLYTIILALGQMLGATSFQITLLSGQNYQGDLQLYVLGCVFFVASLVWYALFRYRPSIHVLVYPWVFYGLAFFLVGLPSVSDGLSATAHDVITSVATWSYAVASAAAFLFYGLNFGEEAGAATEVWTMRACVVQGSQQIWVTALWYWGHQLNGALPGSRPPWWILIVLWPLSIMCFVFMWCLRKGLPDYYRQSPPKVPNFVRTLFRRKLVLWFLASEILRDYWLSGPYGRNWSFLWNAFLPTWTILILVIIFFIGVWWLMLYFLTSMSKTHTWFLPVFAVGLGAPRWCQMLWGTSSLALYIPWAGKAGPYLGTCLWLWLGVLDAIQGVGLGMILLQTLSRLHVCATLAFAQLIGCVCVMVARATAPNRIGPGSVFPDASKWDFSKGLEGSPMASGPFWVAMICQVIIVMGYFWFYRKEQLSRP